MSLPGEVPSVLDLPAVDAALTPVVECVRRAGATHEGVTVLKAHAGLGSQGGSVTHVLPDARLDTRPELDDLPALREALPTGARGLAVEVQTQPNGWWKAVLCWADDLDAFTSPRRALRDHLDEPGVPRPLPEVRMHPALLAARWKASGADHDPAPPAAQHEITRTATILGYTVPSALLQLAALGDGLPFRHDGGYDGLLGGYQPMSLAETRRWWEQDRATGRDPFTLGRVVERWRGVIAPVHVHPAWVPFADDGGGNALCLDLAPGPQGRPGQVIELGRDLHEGPRLVAWSLDDLLVGQLVEPEPREPRLVIDLRKSGGGELHPEQLRAATTQLGLFGFDRAEVRHLLGCPALEELIVRSRAMDLEGVARLPLRDLRIMDAEHVDLAPLAGHPMLTDLTVSDLAEGATVVGAQALASAPHLRRVTLPTVVWAQAAPLLRDHPRLAVATFDRQAPLEHVLQVAAAFDRPGRVLADSTLVRSSEDLVRG